VTYLAKTQTKKVVDTANTEAAATSEDTEGVDYSTLYLTAAYGIKHSDFIGMEFYWGESERQIDDKLLLEGRLARFSIQDFSDQGPSIVRVTPNLGFMVIDQKNPVY
jgi:hypothetical protein